MVLPPYNKPHRTPTEIVDLLEARGLEISNHVSAANAIDRIGYMRLRAYLESRCDRDKPGRPFSSGVNFQDILNIYECDAKLRTVCFEAVGKFELLFRNNISETLSLETGSHPQYTESVFKDTEGKDNILNIFQETYDKQLNRDGLAKEYNENFSSPDLPPIWYMKEMLSFGDTVKLYVSLNESLGKKIAKNFGCPKYYIFINWIVAFNELRNVCGHHDRLFNRSFHKSLRRLRLNNAKNAKIPPENIRNGKLAGHLTALDRMMNTRGVPVNIESQVTSILKKYPVINITEVGYFFLQRENMM